MLRSSSIAVAVLFGSVLGASQQSPPIESRDGSRVATRERAASEGVERGWARAIRALARVLPPVRTSSRPPIVPFPVLVTPRKISNATVALGLPAGAQFGYSVAAIGDLDGDGVPDLAVGAPGDAMGSVRIFFLNRDRTVRAHTRIGAPSSAWGHSYGSAVCGLGDLNGDGAPDVAASSPWDCGVFVHLLHSDGTVLSTVRITDSLDHPVFAGVLESYGEGLAALGDVDGDGVTDMAVACGVGSDGDDPRIYVVFLNANGTVKGFHRNSIGSTGLTCGALADLDGDGIHEFATGNSNDRNVRTYFLNPNGSVRLVRSVLSSQYATPVAGVQDLDGNGVPDWALGIPTYAGGQGVYSLAGLDSAGNVIPGSGVLVTGPEGKTDLLNAGDHFGSSLALLGNLDGIGEPEIAVGATGVDDGTANSGAVWIGAIR